MDWATLRRRLRAAPRAFASREDGMVAVVVGVALLPMIGLMGGATDVSRALSMKGYMQGVSDAAALAAGAEFLGDGDYQARQAAAGRVATARCAGGKCGNAMTWTYGEGAGEATVTIAGQSPNAFLGLFQRPHLDLTVSASISVGYEADLYFLLDMSGSMNIPFGRDAILDLNAAQRFYDDPNKSCSFACHRVEGSVHPTRTGAAIARDEGIPLREDEVRRRTRQVIDDLTLARNQDLQIGVATFGGDYYDDLETMTNPTTSRPRLRRAVDDAVGTSHDTDYAAILPEIGAWIARTRRQGRPAKAVLLTDGVTSVGLNPSTVIDTRLCDALKASDVTVYVMNIVYPDTDILKGNSAKIAEVAAIYDQLDPALRDCASGPDTYFRATDGVQFHQAFDDLSSTLFGMGRLRLTQ